MTTPFNSVASMVRAARGEETQEVFARRIGKQPYMVSRYESGDASPPSAVINRCLEIIASRSRTPSAADIASVVLERLDGVHNEHIRTAIWAVIRSAELAKPRIRSVKN